MNVEYQFLNDEPSLMTALKEGLHFSGQLLKKHFAKKDLERSWSKHKSVVLPLDLVNHGQINPEYLGPEVRILKETDTYIAIHKPAGIHSHPHRYSDKNTVLNALVKLQKWDVLSVNTENYDRGLLFRLDQDTSGVLILAKTSQYFERLRKNFNAEMKMKVYLAIVEGSFNKEGRHTHYFKASEAKGSKQKVGHDGEPGSLSVRKLAEANGLSLVEVELKTGLRHQIRAQLAALGYPILGDELYGGRPAERLFLHAYRYEWDDVVEDSYAEMFNKYFP